MNGIDLKYPDLSGDRVKRVSVPKELRDRIDRACAKPNNTNTNMVRYQINLNKFS